MQFPRLPLCEDGRRPFEIESNQRMPLGRNFESAQDPLQKMNLQLSQDVEHDGQNLCNRWRIWKQVHESAAAYYRLCLPTFDILEKKVIDKGQQFLYIIEKSGSGTFQRDLLISTA